MADRKLKRPDGHLHEEYITSGLHSFEDGKIYDRDTSAGTGEYTGRFWFEYPDGRLTRRYTLKSAPKWLAALYLEATTG